MAYLADTHVLIWFLAGDPRLGRRAYRIIEDAIAGGALCLSAMSCYELLVAAGKPRWPLSVTAPEALNNVAAIGISIIDIQAREAKFAAELSLPHWDPIDRLIVATAYLNTLTLVTGDKVLVSASLPCRVIDARL